MRKTAIVGMLVLFAVLVIPAASASEYYLSPDDSSADYGEAIEVAIWIDATENIRSGKITLEYDSSCGNITSCTRNTTVFQLGTDVINHANDILIFTYGSVIGEQPAGQYHIANFTIQCNSTTYCTSDLLFVYQTYARNNTAYISTVTDNGTFACGTPPSAETFSKPLYKGWNLISLPLVPENNSAGAVLSGVSYDAVYRYNATSKQFEVAGVMDPGTGYFVHATADCTWEYSGTAYTSMDTSLEEGLNMVGWLNCSKDIDDALSSISGDYYYVARWNATVQRFEMYNPRAPAVFNDFTTIDRGTGYFISAREGCTLSESC